ncbi:MAG: ABC transporter permease [Hydrogenibacillus schlegelii]|uniref:ABC transporter permease n=1 Tax=Hydrogenibacillus schlegelii TaxID=1484 RepID=A0A947CXC3_HYDSH|nr:ABC transporter permease [Hydrogenibacillus schlegelii]
MRRGTRPSVAALFSASAADAGLAIVFGLIVGAGLMLLGGFDPLAAYRALAMKAFGSPYNAGETFRQATTLMLTGLSVALAYRAGLLSIAAPGQMALGALAAAAAGIGLPPVPVVQPVIGLLLGAAAGALWGALIGTLRAYRGVNEVIAAIMLNWVALYGVNLLIRFGLADPANRQRTRTVAETARIDAPWLSDLFAHARLSYGFFLAVALLGAYAFFLHRTRLGFELRAVGQNPVAAALAGMKDRRLVVAAMALAGGPAGLAGAIEALGVYGYWTVSPTLPAAGFDGIAVALLGGAGALGTALAALLFAALSGGAAGMQFEVGVPPELARVVMAAILFFIAAQNLTRGLRERLGRVERRNARGEEAGR